MPDAQAEPPLQVRPSLPGILRPAANPNTTANISQPGNAGPGAPLVAPRPTESTIDLGTGIETLASTPAVTPEASRERGARTLGELAGEKLGGFAPSTGLRIEVLGARTGARFVVSSVDGIDELSLIAALETSRDREITDFSELTDFSVTSRPLISKPWEDDVREGINEFFAASGLPAPKALVDLDLSNVKTWIKVQGNVETYVPGSTVFLITTSEPVVLGTAEVDKFGKAFVSGSMPVEALGPGAHSVRVVGTRALDGITVDANGEIQLSSEVLQEIERFDGGTQATVAVSGLNPNGGYHTAVRVVPLDLTIYWWMLIFILLALIVVGLARYYRKLRSRKARFIAAAVIVASAIPGMVAAWLQSTTWLLVAALVLGALGAVASWFIREKKAEPRRKK